MVKLDTVKKVARWAAPTVVLLALYLAVSSTPNLLLVAVLVALGVALSWHGPYLVGKVKDLVNKVKGWLKKQSNK